MGDTPDYSRSFGGQALAARLRRASDRVDRDGTRIYAAQKVRFEQRWYGVLRQLVNQGDMSVGEIAAALRITHVSVSQACRSMEKAGIIKSAASATDARRRNLSLTPKGRALVKKLSPLWDAFNAAAEELNAEAGNVVKLLDLLDDALERKSMFDRINAQLAKSTRG
jgi:DNA-binding MarR family transcriptional regulator